MSNNRIFAGSRYQMQGRNVNLTGTMFKRSPIFNHTTVEKVETSPFSNYSCKTGQSFLSESQASIPQNQLSPDAIRQLIKEQLLKVHAPEEANRKLMHTLQAQITDLKERIAQYEKENNKKLQEAVITLKGDFRVQAQQMGKDVQLQISNKLRNFFQKANLQLKKDILKTAEEQFLTIAQADDFENRLQALNQKIDSVNTLISTNKITSVQEKEEKSVVLSEQIQNKMNKLQKELQQNKKHTFELVSKFKNFQEWKQEEINKRSQKLIQEKLEHLKQKVKSIEQQVQKKLGTLQIKQTGVEGDISIIRQKIIQLQKRNEDQSLLFLDFSKRVSSKGRESDQNELVTSLIIPQKQLEVQADLNSKPQIQAKQQAMRKQVYQLDSQGYLMDGDRKYLLTDENKMIKLSQEQIEVLLSSTVIQIIEK